MSSRLNYLIKPWWFLWLFFLLWCTRCLSQDIQKADSLTTVLKTQTLSKKETARLLTDIAYYHPNLDTALSLAKQSLQIATGINDPMLRGEALEEISHIQRRLGNNSASLNATLEALEIYETQGVVERQAASYTQLSSNYISNGDLQPAIHFLRKAANIYKNSDKHTKYARTILNLGEAYRLAENPDSAEFFFHKALRLNIPLQDEIVQSYALGNLAMVYSAKDSFEMAKEKITEALEYLHKLGDPYSISVYTAELGRIYQKEGHWKIAEKKLTEALILARREGLKEQIRDISAMMVTLYEEQQRHDLALKFQKLFQLYQDSLVNKANIQRIEQLQANYKIDKKESEILLLNRINKNQRYLAIVLASGVLIFLGLTYLLYRTNHRVRRANYQLLKQRAEIIRREEEKALLLKELNHRVKNNLQMIASLLNLQSQALSGHPAMEAVTEGKYRVEALSLIHQKLYHEDHSTHIQLREYIKELVLNLVHSYGLVLTPEFSISPISMDADHAIPLGLIINELVTNSLKYAYDSTDHPTLNVTLSKEKDQLYVEVADNGNGFASQYNEQSKSFGIRLVSSLIQQLEGSIERINNNGTRWQMRVKIS